MTIALLFFGILASFGVVATAVVVARDGYRRLPRRSAPESRGFDDRTRVTLD